MALPPPPLALLQVLLSLACPFLSSPPFVNGELNVTGGLGCSGLRGGVGGALPALSLADAALELAAANLRGDDDVDELPLARVTRLILLRSMLPALVVAPTCRSFDGVSRTHDHSLLCYTILKLSPRQRNEERNALRSDTKVCCGGQGLKEGLPAAVLVRALAARAQSAACGWFPSPSTTATPRRT